MIHAGTVRMVVAGAVLAFVLTGAVSEFPVFTRAFFPKKVMTLMKRIREVREKCAEQFPLREGFVTLNGFCVRLAGQHLCNDVVKMEPGDVLISPSPRRVKMTSSAVNVQRFSEFCKTNGAAFLYVLAPKRLDLRQTLLPPGFRDMAYRNADELVALLQDKGVAFADWRERFAATPDLVRTNFYRTDHHWNTDASFAAAGLLADEICGRLSVSEEDAIRARELLEPKSWKRQVMRQCFLGSLGKRTGPGFSRYDDVIVLRPGFKTKMSMEVPSRKINVKGTFEKTVMRRWKELLSIEDGFVSDAYSMIYIGGLYPLVRHHNPLAPLKVKVLLIGDSFARPVEAFLSTAVQDLVAIDPRRRNLKHKGLADMVRREKPDIVIQLQTPNTFSVDMMKGPKTGKAVMFEYGL